jgi:hypothetical protein
LLKSHFLDHKASESLLHGGNAPLGNFSARIKTAYVLGLLTELEFQESETIRRVRNEFAHSEHGVNFKSQKIAALCNNLRALVVVDDAWTIDHADAFSVTAPPARLIITTRNQEVLVGSGAEEHRVNVLSSSDALKMLTEWVGEKSPDKLPPEAAEVANHKGKNLLPLD